MKTLFLKAKHWLHDDEPVWPLPQYMLEGLLVMVVLASAVLGYGVVFEDTSPFQLYPFALLGLVTASHIKLRKARG